MTLDQLDPNFIHFLVLHLEYIRGKVVDGALPEIGKALITVLKDKLFAKNEAAKKAAEDLAQNPQDPDNKADFETQLRKALKADPALKDELAALARSAGLQLTITGDNNKTAVVTGNNNTIQIS